VLAIEYDITWESAEKCNKVLENRPNSEKSQGHAPLSSILQRFLFVDYGEGIMKVLSIKQIKPIYLRVYKHIYFIFFFSIRQATVTCTTEYFFRRFY
jgi:hypothetical protein